jgi:hypothetical protein
MNHEELRTVALDVRSRKFGFVVFDGSRQMLDWGIRSYGSAGQKLNQEVKIRVKDLLDMFVPGLLILRVPNIDCLQKDKRVERVVKTLHGEAKLRSIPVRVLSRPIIKRVFVTGGLKSKYEVASWLRTQFPDLSWNILKKRKPWHSENYSTSIFDAAAAGAVHLGFNENHATNP